MPSFNIEDIMRRRARAIAAVDLFNVQRRGA
jgi:hypothetical protein